MNIYLSGGIYKDNLIATDYWRERATEYLLDRGFTVTNPCRNKLVYDAAAYTPKEITARDHMDIHNADLLLVNGNPVGDHLSWGTAMEIERAQFLGKPIVMFSVDDRTRLHPWCLSYCARIFDTLDETLVYIAKFWGSN